jgi:predicted transglutaminase-like cysteine proteinase
MTITATAVQHDATALAALPVEPAAYTALLPLRSDADGLWGLSGGYYAPSLQLPSIRALGESFDGASASTVTPTEPEPAVIEQPEKLASLEPSRAEGLAEDLALAHGSEPAATHGEDAALPVDNAGHKGQAAGENTMGDHQASLAPMSRMELPPNKPMLTPIVRVQFETPVLAPMAHTFFCLKYRDECKVHKVVFRGGPMALAAKRWAELVRVNAAVNRAIVSHPNRAGLAAEKWLIAPKAGECHDYAVTKRHELIALGWPARDLLLSEVVTSWGEHHLVLVVRTSEGDFVADSLDPRIRDWSSAPYQWVRIQTPGNPQYWSTVASTTVWVKNTGLVHRES